MTNDVEKSDVWYLEITRDSVVKTVYDEPVIKEDAIYLYLQGDEQDILDEYDTGVFTVHGASTTNNDVPWYEDEDEKINTIGDNS